MCIELTNLSHSNRSLNAFVFHYTITAVELGSGSDEGYFASHKQMEHYCVKCCGAEKTVGEIPG